LEHVDNRHNERQSKSCVVKRLDCVCVDLESFDVLFTSVVPSYRALQSLGVALLASIKVLLPVKRVKLADAGFIELESRNDLMKESGDKNWFEERSKSFPL